MDSTKIQHPKQITLCTISEYAEEHKVDRHTVYDWIAKGKLTVYVLEEKKYLNLMEKVEKTR